MKKEIIVNLTNNHEYNCDCVIIARKNENRAACFKIIVPKELKSKWLYIDFEKMSGITVKTPKIEIDSEGYAHYDICNNLTDEVGKLKAEIIFQDESGYVWKSFRRTYQVVDAICATEEIEKEHHDFISNAQKTIDEATNLDINVSENGDSSIVTITEKDGTQKTIELKDGNVGPTGEKGQDGLSAFDSAQKGGYTGTEQQFYTDLAYIQNIQNSLEAI